MMNNETKDRLRKILQERRKNLRSIHEFQELFFTFSRKILRNVAEDISHYLEMETDDFIKVFKDDPVEFNNTRYFAMVILNSRARSRMIEFNSNETNPSLKFEGKEINGRVVVSQKLIDDKKYKEVGVFPIAELTEEKTSELLVDFIESAFK